MRRLLRMGLSGTYLTPALLVSLVGAVFILLVLVRVTTPRFRLETLSRLGWGVLLGLLLVLVSTYALGLWLG